MTGPSIPARVLLVEDNPGDARLVDEMLGTVPAFDVVMVDRMSAAEPILRRNGIDAVLLDLGLPDSQGLDSLERVLGIAPSIPVVVLSGLDDTSTAVEAVRGGAQDYLIKGDLDGERLGQSIALAIERRRAIEEREKRLESIGLLAGGLAHDFNNILTGIMGSVSLARLTLAAGEDPDADFTEAVQGVTRAKMLTQQLLAFSRGGVPSKVPTSVVETVREIVEPLLRDRNVDVVIEIPSDLLNVLVDPYHFEQVIEHLVRNAREAMPDGGTMTIRAENLHLTRETGRLLNGLQPGDHVMLVVADEGVGIAEDHLQRVFDPYFTTDSGRQGIGLALCHTIVKKHTGHISVASTPGRGSEFTVILPATSRPVRGVQETMDFGPRPLEGRRVLVMDDQDMIRRLLARMLERSGCTVVTTEDGAEALACYREALDEGARFDAVIADLTVPEGMGGREMMQRILEIDPDAVGIVASGYSDDAVLVHFERHGFRAALEKPFGTEVVIDTLAQVLSPDDN